MDRIGQFVLVLSDHPLTDRIVEKLGGLGDIRLRHDSGRPWLIVKYGTDPVVHQAVGDKEIALVGPSSANPHTLGRLLSRADGSDELVQAASRFDGSFLVFARLPGALIARGPAMQTRRLFTSKIDGVHIVSDRADVLAYLGDQPLEHDRVRLHLVLGLPSPADDRPVWRGVESVPGDMFVVVMPDGSSAWQLKWWTRPAPATSRREGSERLRLALQAAINVRTSDGSSVVADLSGGLDSTPVCYFAAQGPRGCVAKTVYADHPGGREDLLWAMKALPSMPGVTQHLTYSVDEMPEFFDDLDVPILPDEPTDAAMVAPRQLQMLQNDAAIGATVHLTGNGGDHLFRGIPNWYQDIFRKDPRIAWRQVRSDQMFAKHRAFSLMRQFTDRRSFRQWYAAAVARAAESFSGASVPVPLISDWSIPVELTSLLSKGARESLVEELSALADTVTPLGSTAAEHFDLFHLRVAGKAARGMNQIGDIPGVRVDAPLLDDHVAEAVLAVAYEERDSPIEWKPLMKMAMSGHLPDDYLTRTTKTGGGAQAIRGYENNFPNLVKLWDDAGLFDSGWFDRVSFLRETQPSPTREPSKFIYRITNVAMFLKARSSQTTNSAI